MRRGNILANLDWLTILLWLLMIIMGWLNIYSAVYSVDSPGIFDFNQRYGKQFFWILAALILAIVILVIDHKFYEFFGYIFFFFAILLLMGVLVAGKEINGAKSWFVIGGFQIQPSEFAKPAVAFALAKYLSGFNLKINSFRTYLITAAIIFTPAVLILLQPDAGSTMVFFAFLLPVYREGFPVSILLILVSLVVLFIMFLLLPKFIILLVVSGIALLGWGLYQKSFKLFIRSTTVFILSLFVVFGISWLMGKRESNELIIVLIAMLLSSLVYIIAIIQQRIRFGSA